MQIFHKGHVSQDLGKTRLYKYERAIREGEISRADSWAAPRRLREGKHTYQMQAKKKNTPLPVFYYVYFSSCPSVPYGPNSKIKWTLWAHKYFTNLKINLKATLSFLYPSNVKQLLVSVHLTFLIRLGVRLHGFH